MSSESVLLVDDDVDLLLLNQQFLKGKGYQVFTAKTAKEGYLILKKQVVDCIVLDVMMPGADGFKAFGKFKEVSEAPILFMTGRSSDEDRIRGLMLGGDDYIVKPCSLEELSLRIAINIRKSKLTKPKKDILEFPPLVIHLLTQDVYYNDAKVQLSSQEYRLLVLLASHVNEPITFEEIGNELNGSYIEEDRKTVMVTTSRLRKKLESYPGLAQKIETVWGKGYLFRG